MFAWFLSLFKSTKPVETPPHKAFESVYFSDCPSPRKMEIKPSESSVNYPATPRRYTVPAAPSHKEKKRAKKRNRIRSDAEVRKDVQDVLNSEDEE